VILPSWITRRGSESFLSRVSITRVPHGARNIARRAAGFRSEWVLRGLTRFGLLPTRLTRISGQCYLRVCGRLRRAYVGCPRGWARSSDPRSGLQREGEGFSDCQQFAEFRRDRNWDLGAPAIPEPALRVRHPLNTQGVRPSIPLRAEAREVRSSTWRRWRDRVQGEEQGDIVQRELDERTVVDQELDFGRPVFGPSGMMLRLGKGRRSSRSGTRSGPRSFDQSTPSPRRCTSASCSPEQERNRCSCMSGR
jgi:hypothetical protein